MKKLVVSLLAVGLLAMGAATVRAAHFQGVTLWVSVDPEISISVDVSEVFFSTITISSSVVGGSGIVVTNDSVFGGLIDLHLGSYDVKESTQPAAAVVWTLAQNPAANAFSVCGLFNNSMPSLADFNNANDAVFPDGAFLAPTINAGNGRFEGDNNGVGLAQTESRTLYVKFDSPTSITQGSGGLLELTLTVLGQAQ